MTTDELIRELRLYAEQHQDNSAFLLGLIYQAADRLEALDERVAIMSDGNQITMDEIVKGNEG